MKKLLIGFIILCILFLSCVIHYTNLNNDRSIIDEKYIAKKYFNIDGVENIEPITPLKIFIDRKYPEIVVKNDQLDSLEKINTSHLSDQQKLEWQLMLMSKEYKIIDSASIKKNAVRNDSILILIGEIKNNICRRYGTTHISNGSFVREDTLYNTCFLDCGQTLLEISDGSHDFFYALFKSDKINYIKTKSFNDTVICQKTLSNNTTDSLLIPSTFIEIDNIYKMK